MVLEKGKSTEVFDIGISQVIVKTSLTERDWKKITKLR